MRALVARGNGGAAGTYSTRCRLLWHLVNTRVRTKRIYIAGIKIPYAIWSFIWGALTRFSTITSSHELHGLYICIEYFSTLCVCTMPYVQCGHVCTMPYVQCAHVCTMPYVQCGHVRLNTTFHKMGRVSSALERCLNSQWTKFVSKLTPTHASIHSLSPPPPPLSPFCLSCHSFVWVLRVFLVRTAAVTHVSCS